MKARLPRDPRPPLAPSPPRPVPSSVEILEQLDNELLSAVEEPPPPPSAAAGVDAGSRGSPLTAQLQAPEQLASKLSAMNRLLRTQEAELQRRDEQLAALQAENARLVREQGEMRRFLADYGLQWVGGSKPSSALITAATISNSSVKTECSAHCWPMPLDGRTVLLLKQEFS